MPALQLLHDLPAPLLSAVCSFLSVYQVVCILRSTCRALHDAVSEDCLLHHHLTLDTRTLPSLVVSKLGTRALIRRIPSLSLYYQHTKRVTEEQLAMLPLHSLRCPLDASRFLFSSLSSLFVSVAEEGDTPCDTALKHRFLLSVLLLLAANPESFPTLHRLQIRDQCYTEQPQGLQLPFASLQRLQGLTHLRIQLRNVSALSSSSLVSALSSMPSLTWLELGQSMAAWPELLPQLCSEAATPLLLRLQTLKLSEEYNDEDDSVDEPYDAFLRRLGALPAPPALQHFSGMDVKHRAAGLL